MKKVTARQAAQSGIRMEMQARGVKLEAKKKVIEFINCPVCKYKAHHTDIIDGMCGCCRKEAQNNQ